MSDQKFRFIYGSTFLVSCIIVYILQTFKIKSVLKDDYKQPFVILWYSHSFLAIIIPVLWIFESFNFFRGREPVQFSEDGENYGTFRRLLINPTRRHFILIAELLGLGKNDLFRAFLQLQVLSLLNTVPSYLWYLALSLTYVSRVTVIFNSSVLFTFIFSVLVLKEKITWQKAIACVSSIAGVVVITLDSSEPKAPSALVDTNFYADKDIMGGILAFFAAVLYGLYLVLYKKMVSPTEEVAHDSGFIAVRGDDVDEDALETEGENEKNENVQKVVEMEEAKLNEPGQGQIVINLMGDAERIPNQQLEEEQATSDPVLISSSTRHDIYSSLVVTGWIGVLTLFTHWPIYFIVIGLGAESFRLPNSWETLNSLTINALSALSYNIFYMLGVVMLSPLICQVTVLITVPISIIIELIKYGWPIKATQVIGLLVLIIAIWLINRK